MIKFYVKDNVATQTQGIAGQRIFSMVDIGRGMLNVLVTDDLGQISGPFVIEAGDAESRREADHED